MSLDTKLWNFEDDLPKRLKSRVQDHGERLEDWICDDIGLLNKEYLFIDRQIPLRGGELDRSDIENEANLVVIEFERDKTSRDVVAQNRDYALYGRNFGLEEIVASVSGVSRLDLTSTYKKKFGYELPEVIK